MDTSPDMIDKSSSPFEKNEVSVSKIEFASFDDNESSIEEWSPFDPSYTYSASSFESNFVDVTFFNGFLSGPSRPESFVEVP